MRTILPVILACLACVAPALAQTTIATLPVGASPHGVAVSPEGTTVYVVNRDSDNVSVIDVASQEVTGVIPVGQRPEGVAFSPDGVFAYVTNDRSNNISIIDVAAGAVTGSIFLQDPQALAVTSDGAFAWVTQSGGGGRRNSVSLVDLVNGVVVSTIPDLAARPRAVALSPDDTLAYITNRESNLVTVIREGALSGTIATGLAPYDVAFAPDGTLAYVANRDSNTVSVIDTLDNSVVNDMPLTRPEGLDVTSDGLYAAIAGGQPGNFLFLVDLSTGEVLGQAPIGLNPERVAITPDDTLAYVTNRGSGTVSVVALFGAAARSARR